MAAGGGDVGDLLRGALADPGTSWSLGALGALAVFARPPRETVRPPCGGRLGLVTDRGALALTPDPALRPLAYETAFADGWSHAVALCLPAAACAMGARTVLTELGPDAEAARDADRGAILFDLGLGLRAVDACARAGEPGILAALRAGLGRPLLAPGNPARRCLEGLGTHRVFVARIGRIEVFAPDPPAGPPDPEGPRVHLLPRLIARGRTHASTAPIPDGFVPCGALHPPHPCRDPRGAAIPFRRDRHAAFQRLLETWGEPALLAAKWAGSEDACDGARPRYVRAARRAAALQARHLAEAPPDPDAG